MKPAVALDRVASFADGPFGCGGTALQRPSASNIFDMLQASPQIADDAVSQHLNILRHLFPEQVYLTPKDIAAALYGPDRATKKRTECVRADLDSGTLIPGLRKAPGQKRWRVSIVALAAALDQETPSQPVFSPCVGPRRTSRFKNPGPRLVR